MDCEDIVDFEHLFQSDDLDLPSPSIEEFVQVVDEVAHNDNVDGGTMLCFQIFCSVITNEDYNQLNIFSQCVKQLKNVDKFDEYLFVDHFCSKFPSIPFEVVWWLHKNEILCFSEYCNNKLQPEDMAHTLKDILTLKIRIKIFSTDEILQDLLVELFRGCYISNNSCSKLLRRQMWSDYCLKVLNNLKEETLKVVYSEVDEPFVNFFPFIENLNKYIPNSILRQFYTGLLNKLMTYNVNEFDLCSSYIYQELWCSKNINKNLRIMYEEIFKKYCDMNTILKIIHDYEEEINWKYTLAAMGICIQQTENGRTALKDAAIGYLNTSFKGGIFEEFIKSILFIRQGCMETNMKLNYQTWYSSIFGINSNFKITTHAPLFHFCMASFTKLIPFEPKAYLNIQIDHGITAPPQCNFLIHNYKDLCRARLQELNISPTVLVKGVEMIILHMVEGSVRNGRINPIMVITINKQRDDFYNTIVPQVLQNKMPYIKVKKLLLENNYLSNEIINFLHANPVT